MTTNVGLSPVYQLPQFFDNNGDPLAAGTISAYISGSFSTEQTTYSTSLGTVANPNPIVLDGSGRPNTSIWLETEKYYNLVLRDAAGTVLDSVDNVLNLLSGKPDASEITSENITVTSGQTLVNLTNQYTVGAGLLQVFVNGSLQNKGTDYNETSPGSITFITPLHAGDVVSASTYNVNVGTSTTANLVGFTQSGSSTIRTVQSKLTDFVSTKDFGALCDYSFDTSQGTDDTAAVQAAINWCSANKRVLYQAGVSKITAPLVFPSQIEIRGAGAARTYDSGFNYAGTGTMVTGVGGSKTLAFVNIHNLVFGGPGMGSGVDCFYGDFYQGGIEGCLFNSWRTCVTTFGTLNTFKHNRFATCVNGIIVTNWPAGSAQPNASTTTFLSERNSYFGLTGYGLKFDSSTTGSENFLNCTSNHDVFEQNDVGLYLNKSYDFLLISPHFEFHDTYSYQIINSRPTIIRPYFHPDDIPKISITYPGAAANSAGFTGIDYEGVRSTQFLLSTLGVNDVGFKADDTGKLVPVGAGLVGTWTPNLGSTTGISSGNTYSFREGDYTRIGSLCICTFRIVLLTKDGGMSGNLSITGLPFLADVGKSNAYANVVRMTGVTFSGGAYATMVLDVVSTDALLVKIGSGLNPAYVTPAEITGTAQFSGTIIYLTT